MLANNAELHTHLSHLLDVGQALSSERNFDVLMEKILVAAKKLSNADGGTLYMMTPDSKFLEFKVVRTDSLNIYMGGTNQAISWKPLPLYKNDGTQNKEMVAALCALTAKSYNIEDVYEAEGFNFEGTKAFDQNTKYRTKSMLIVPMMNHENDVIGVLQLLNKQDIDSNTIAFDEDDEKIILSLASQAAISITNNIFISDFEKLLDSFIRSIASAIDEKSRYTGGHIGRVAEISLLFIEAINEDNSTGWKKYNENEKKEIMYAAWMHDIGKITTPEYVVDKATKLQTIYDRIETVKVRFELLKMDLKFQLANKDISFERYQKSLEEVVDDFAFLSQVNKGCEYMPQADIARVYEIARKYIIEVDGKKQNILDDNEVLNLVVRKGTLSEEERQIINNHALVSINMLNKLHFPKKLSRVPEIAGGHHEKICGGGYPLNLRGDEISFEARILAIADIFEALTASDRPYKEANSMNQALKILHSMAQKNELDRDLVKFFIQKNLHLKYAEHNFHKNQFDEINVSFDDL